MSPGTHQSRRRVTARRRRHPSASSHHRGTLLGLGAIAALALPAVPTAQAQVSASVSSGANARYVGGDADNNVRFTLNGASIPIDDIVPLAVGAGCEPVAGDPTKATCVAPKIGNKFKESIVAASLGNDRVVNSTSTTTTVGVPMQANGGPGNDELIGDLKADDELRGLAGQNELEGGSDDVLDGGLGRDRIVGGAGSDILNPSSPPNVVIPVGAVPDNDVDVVDCGEVGPNPADPGEIGFRVLSDGDLIHDCATVFNQ